ncbi:MAG: hypothetical protein ACPG4K_06200 [Haloferula sp.]
MKPFLANIEIPTEVVSVLFLLLISLANWIKNKVEQKKREELGEEEEDPMREIIWRRQMGELEPEEEPFRGGPPPMPTIRIDRREPAAAPVQAAPPPIQPTVVSEKEEGLAAAFEQNLGRRARRKSNHRSQVDRLLRSPYAAKNAILLTEILGPPVALRSQSDR